jgi:predicted restriction endonuclease
MSSEKKKIREAFRSAVFARDKHKCRTCGWSLITPDTQLDAHHITDRNLMPNGGYVAANGISLCPACHEKAEEFHSTGVAHEGFSPEDLYKLIGSTYDIAVRDSKLLK